jgi:hypothetical protein
MQVSEAYPHTKISPKISGNWEAHDTISSISKINIIYPLSISKSNIILFIINSVSYDTD